MLFDSNIVIYAVEPEGAFLSRWFADFDACIASVTQIEALGFARWASLDEDRQGRLEKTIGRLAVLPLDDEIVARAIELRRIRRMSLGDSIIAATALCYGLRFVTRNVDDFRHIAGLEIVNPFETT